MPAAAVIGRDQELSSIEGFLDEVERGPSALVLSGEAGIGKTSLWEAGLEEARRRSCRVLSHRSVEAEASLAFGGLSDLLAPVLDEVASSLAPPRRRALEVALRVVDPGDQPPDPLTIGLGFLDVLRLLSERTPVIVALDDLQWLDSSSAAVVQMAVRRVREERVGLLATLRGRPDAAAVDLGQSLPDGRLRWLPLGPVSLGALHQLLKERLGVELTRPELARVQEASGGNPFFAIELARTGSRPLTGEAWRVPDSLQQLLGGRLARLPADANEVLLRAAALGRPTVELVTAAHEDRDRALDAIDLAVRDGLVESDGSRLRFSHPLLATICYEQAPLARRRAVHRALAGVVDDLEERARHLARAADGPDRAVASELKAAAEQAASRGATAAAAELCELAAGLTPQDDAPDQRRLRLQAAEFHRLAGDGERAVALLEELLSEVPSGPERSDVLFGLLQTLRGEPWRMLALSDEALAEAAADDARSVRILAFRMGLNLWKGDARAALSDSRAALESAERVGDPALVATAIARVAQSEAYAAQVTPGLIDRGLEIEERHGLVLEYHSSPRYALTRVLMRLDQLDRPRAVLEDLEANAAARGDEGTRGMVLWTLAMLEWLAGRWPRALEHARAAHELALQTQHPHGLAWIGRLKALVEADLGLVAEARASAEEGLEFARATSNEFFTRFCQATLGRLELALGELGAAGDLLRGLPGRLLAGGFDDPTLPVWADTIETLVGLGELERARTYQERYELNSKRLGSAWALAAAARCRGLLAAANGDLEDAFDAFEEALARLGGLPYPLERARTLLCLGSARRQAKQKRLSRDALEQALELFEELGARLWADKARAELRRISGRRRASQEELTEMEERVAALAAQGRSNKEIAAELFVSVHTVGAHLSRVYRKLEIHSRSELAAGLAKRANDGPKTASEAAKV